ETACSGSARAAITGTSMTAHSRAAARSIGPTRSTRAAPSPPTRSSRTGRDRRVSAHTGGLDVPGCEPTLDCTPVRKERLAIKDYYVVLGIPRNEDPRGIREAYRQLAKRYHPDRAGPEANTAFREVVEAYEALSDPERRSRFDRSLRRTEGRLDVAPDTIVLDDEPPPEPLSPEPVSLMRGFRRMHPSRAA